MDGRNTTQTRRYSLSLRDDRKKQGVNSPAITKLEIRNKGDKVIIRTKPTITINPYETDQALAVERPTSNIVELTIDKGYYFNTILDDVMETQADLNLLSMWSDDASIN